MTILSLEKRICIGRILNIIKFQRQYSYKEYSHKGKKKIESDALSKITQPGRVTLISQTW